jgi:hypothetical protein
MEPRRPLDQNLEQHLRDAATRVEADVKRLITYINDEVVPDVRRNGSAALRAAAAEIERLAGRMEDASNPPPPPRPPTTPPKSEP